MFRSGLCLATQLRTALLAVCAGLLISASYQIRIGPEQRSSQRLRTIMRKPR
jgi:hypothetical protein